MPRPPDDMVVKWRELAEDGFLYAEISRLHPGFSVDQVRHYCLGHTGRNLGGPIQRVDRWYGSNVWLRGENSPHAELTIKQAQSVLGDWDDKSDRWKLSGAEWARKFGVSRQRIHQVLGKVEHHARVRSSAKLTEAKVREARRLRARGYQRRA